MKKSLLDSHLVKAFSSSAKVASQVSFFLFTWYPNVSPAVVDDEASNGLFFAGALNVKPHSPKDNMFAVKLLTAVEVKSTLYWLLLEPVEIGEVWQS